MLSRAVFLPHLVALGDRQLRDGLVWKVQGCFIHVTGALTRWLEGWALLRLLTGAPTCGLPSMVVPGLFHGSSRLTKDPGRSCEAFSDLAWEISEHHFLYILLGSRSLTSAGQRRCRERGTRLTSHWEKSWASVVISDLPL